MKQITIILSRKGWEKLHAIKEAISEEHQTYEEYLEEQKKKPLKALFG